ncbi:MAG: hypothetical protein WBD67_07265 [Terracidiphilus sp.]
MELLDRYLQAVARHLPRHRQQDILAELRANLEAQLEDKESALGRPLTQGESEDWLREIGSPIQVAGRYLPQQALIGPSLFPIYWYVLRIALFWALLIYTIASAVRIELGQAGAPPIPVAILGVPGILFIVAAWVTLIFAALEFLAARFPQHFAPFVCKTSEWSPATLPPIEKNPFAPRKYAHAVAELVFGFLFLVWLLLIPQYPFLMLGPGVVLLHTSPYLLNHHLLLFYVCFAAFIAFQLLWRGIDFVRGAWQRPNPAQHFVIKAAGLVPLIVLLYVPGQQFLLLRDPLADAARYASNLSTLNGYIHRSILVLIAIVSLQLLWDVGRYFRDARNRAA